jgi:hypothetical protein
MPRSPRNAPHARDIPGPHRVPIIQTPWLRVVREKTAELWASQTGHLPGVNRGNWASELMRACADTQGHLSLPCSLREQADYIGVFLMSPSFDNSPVLFLKLYTMLLGEFNGQLQDVSRLMKFDIGKPPRLTSVWANCWAKHALSILVQHHPRYVFADELGTDWAVYNHDHSKLVMTDPSGKQYQPPIIDTEWLCSNSQCTDPQSANFSKPPVVVVPPLATFIQECMQYYRKLIDGALEDPCRIRMFEGPHNHNLLVELKDGVYAGRPAFTGR